ncbi:MAG: nucleotidyltransferase [Clostridia bacterium]|nr:nucleotidyltransferase [Clostridia bacterium]
MNKVLGIIAEYNPFHNGHLYHLNESKKAVNADYTVAIISGNFVQRGDTSLVDKWSKAEMAIKNGVDLVIELPLIYSISSAENFAEGAIKILNSLNIVDYLSFGSELCDVRILDDFAKILYNEPKEFVSILNHELGKGISYPKARENALLMYLNDIRKYANVLSCPNNILAIEYLKALKKYKSNIIPLSINRNKVDYNSTEIVDGMASATAIRKIAITNDVWSLRRAMPKSSFDIMYDSLRSGHTVPSITKFEKEIIYNLRKMNIAEIADLPDVSEGLEYSIKNAANSCNTIDELINIIKSKRYTTTRLKRILLYCLLGITKKDMQNSRKANMPYIRVLGFNDKGKDLLGGISHSNPKLEIITSVKKYLETSNNKINRNMLEKDIFATNVYTLGYDYDSISNLDYTHQMIIL